MARVFPGSDFKDVYDARNIYTTNIEGDDYKVRRSANDSNLDPRTNSEFQDKIIDAFSLASRIWKNKKECWKDHFRRGHKLFKYHEVDPTKYSKDLSGYHLAMNILINTLKTNKGTYYDPSCFCITPTDLFGEPLNTYSVLDILQHSKIDYEYREKKLTFDILQPEGEQYNRFRSGVDPNPDTLDRCLLSSVGCVTRDNTIPGKKRDITLVKNIVQWPNLIFKDVHTFGRDPGGIWNHDYFTYWKIPTEDLPVTDGSMRGYQITLGYPFSGESLCNLGNLQITLYTHYDKIFGFIQHTGTEPFFDLYYGNHLLGRYGNGGGSQLLEVLNIPENFLEGSQNTIKWTDALYPVVSGYQSNMYPAGKLTECRLLATVPEGEKTGTCQWDQITQYWDAGTQIEFQEDIHATHAKFNIWGYTGYHCPTLDCLWPYGAIKSIYGSNDMQNWERITGLNQRWPFDGISSSFCYGWSQYHFPYNQSFRYFRTTIGTSMHTFIGGHTGTMLGDPMCEPIQLDDECLGPAPHTRGLIFLEKLKPFEVKPVACRCPEFPCPGEFPTLGSNPCSLSNISRCPDDPTKAIIGDTCVECVGASPKGLLYDYLI